MISNKNRGVIEGSDDYANLKPIMTDVASCIKKAAGGLWDTHEVGFLGGGISTL